ncbi:unnamed protein product [Ilex paraguariensis]|uniref:Uncharacterized protein n=1 Tax=Ilex paraguariensis TaxID=185542 RepID=A0ABC8QZM8_9AQUA
MINTTFTVYHHGRCFWATGKEGFVVEEREEERLKDNLAANFSRELADYIIYNIDVSGGDKIPRKGGPGITQTDLLVCVLFIYYLMFGALNTI